MKDLDQKDLERKEKALESSSRTIFRMSLYTLSLLAIPSTFQLPIMLYENGKHRVVQSDGSDRVAQYVGDKIRFCYYQTFFIK